MVISITNKQIASKNIFSALRSITSLFLKSSCVDYSRQIFSFEKYLRQRRNFGINLQVNIVILTYNSPRVEILFCSNNILTKSKWNLSLISSCEFKYLFADLQLQH